MEGLEENSDPRAPFKTSCFAKARDKSLRDANLILYLFFKSVVWTFYGGWLGSVLLLSISLKKTITVGCDFDTTQAALLRAAPCFWKVLKCLWITVSGLGVHVVHWALGALIFTKIGKLCPLIFISNPLGESLKTREGIKPGFGQLYSSGPPIARWTNAQALSFALSSIQLPCPTWRATRCRGDACLDFCLSPRHACLCPTLSRDLRLWAYATPWGPFRQDIHSQAGVVFTVVTTADRGETITLSYWHTPDMAPYSRNLSF